VKPSVENDQDDDERLNSAIMSTGFSGRNSQDTSSSRV